VGKRREDGWVEIKVDMREEIKAKIWSKDEHQRFLEGIKIHGKNWKQVAEVVGTRNIASTTSHA